MNPQTAPATSTHRGEASISWPSSLQPVSNCPCCGNAARTTLHEKLEDRIFGAPGRWDMVRCGQCGSGYLDPQPGVDSIHLAYASYYTHVGTPASIGLFGRIKRSIKHGYMNRRWGMALSPSSKILGLLAALMPPMRAKVEHEIMRDLAANPEHSAAAGHLLDVGCGNGVFLELARQAGWQVAGVDFDEKAVSVARGAGLDVRLGSVDVLADKSEAYDYITLNHVIEHVYDPLETLQACFRLLKPGGTLWIETPNIESDGHREFGRDWRGLEPPRHLVLFTWASLHDQLAQAGFSQIDVAQWRPERDVIDPPSRQIAGLPPATGLRKVLERVLRWKAEIRTIGDHERREFITYIAHKPGSVS